MLRIPARRLIPPGLLVIWVIWVFTIPPKTDALQAIAFLLGFCLTMLSAVLVGDVVTSLRRKPRG